MGILLKGRTNNILLVLAVIVIFVAMGYLFVVKQPYLTEHNVEILTAKTNQITNEKPVLLNQKDQQELEAVVFTTVNQKTNGLWDKKFDIQQTDNSQNAVEGGWFFKDRWDWIAWRQTGGKWSVLVSMDGFDCKELDSVPSQYGSFFHDRMYGPSGERYCYAHNSR